MNYIPDFSRINDKKFRIYVDGSYNYKIKLGAIGCCFPKEYRGYNIETPQNYYSKIYQTKGSIDMEILAIKKGLEILTELLKNNPRLKECIIRIKTDCKYLASYIKDGKPKPYDKTVYSEDHIILLQETREQLKSLQKSYNVKITHIPRKLNFAHNYCYSILRKKYEQILKKNIK